MPDYRYGLQLVSAVLYLESADREPCPVTNVWSFFISLFMHVWIFAIVGDGNGSPGLLNILRRPVDTKGCTIES